MRSRTPSFLGVLGLHVRFERCDRTCRRLAANASLAKCDKIPRRKKYFKRTHSTFSALYNHRASSGLQRLRSQVAIKFRWRVSGTQSGTQSRARMIPVIDSHLQVRCFRCLNIQVEMTSILPRAVPEHLRTAFGAWVPENFGVCEPSSTRTVADAGPRSRDIISSKIVPWYSILFRGTTSSWQQKSFNGSARQVFRRPNHDVLPRPLPAVAPRPEHAVVCRHRRVPRNN